jgi:mono/diheme cytochrome c family protein
MDRLWRACFPARVSWWIVVCPAIIAGFAGCSESRPPARTPIEKSAAAPPTEPAARETTTADDSGTNASPPDVAAPGSKSDVDSTGGYSALTVAQRKRADSLYEQHCATCHGLKGDGNGLAARFLFPKPRNFQAGRFRLVSTVNKVPAMSDLDLVLTRGMPGSSMPPWPSLGDKDRRLLAERVMEFRREGVRERERKSAAEFDEKVDESELAELVQDATSPGPAVDVEPLPPRTPESIVRGRELYLTRGCAACHGNDGTGRVFQKMVDEEGLPATPRDLTQGIFKGNPDEISIYRRTQTGIPGTPMPATQQMTHEQISDLVYFVLSLSDEKTRKATILNRTTITAAAVREVPDDPDDARWQVVVPVHLRMTPLWWRPDFDPILEVRALHDGQSLALSLSWGDPQPDTNGGKVEAFRDAAAVQLFQGDGEPFLGMGAPGKAVELWLWDADRQKGTIVDVEEVNPNTVVDNYPPAEGAAESAEYSRPATRTAAQPGEYLSARAAGNPFAAVPGSPSASALEAGGPGSVTFRPPTSQLVRSRGIWREGRWKVVLIRPLTAKGSAVPVPLKPGARASLAFAVWDGGKRDRDGMKLITIWQDLVLQPVN